MSSCEVYQRIYMPRKFALVIRRHAPIAAHRLAYLPVHISQTSNIPITWARSFIIVCTTRAAENSFVQARTTIRRIHLYHRTHGRTRACVQTKIQLTDNNEDDHLTY